MSYARGYLKGVYRGDGCLIKFTDGTIKTFTIRLNDKRLIDRICLYLDQEYNYQARVREAIIPGSGNTHWQINWVPTKVAVDLCRPPESSEEERGYVGGFYDAEGCYSKHTHSNSWTLTMSQRKRGPLDLIGGILQAKGFYYTLNEHGKNSVSRWCLRLSDLKGVDQKRFFEIFEPTRGR